MIFWKNNSKISISLHFTYHDIDLKSLPCCLPWLFSIKCPFLYHFIFAPTIGLALKLHVKVTSSPSMAWMISVVPLGFKISGLNLTLIVVVCLRWTPFLSSRALKVNFFQKGCFYIEGFCFHIVNIHFFCIFLEYFSKYFLLKLKLFRHNSY